MADNVKIPLPRFLKIFTNQNVPVPKAMAISGKIYKEYNTPAKLAQLDDGKLLAVGLDNRDDRKTVLKALRESGHLSKDPRKKRSNPDQTESPTPGPSSISSLETALPEGSPSKRKRKRNDSNTNEFLPSTPAGDEALQGNLDFHEILDEEVLKFKSCVVNRAPIMMAWSTMVAESMASVYTEMNAKSKGVSLGIYKEGAQLGMEAMKGGSQSYVELMGRRPLYQTQDEQWRALANGEPVKPGAAYSYLSRSLRQTMPHVMGALKLLADSYTRDELNKTAWSLYADFRPSVDQWGQRSEIRCSTILGLRKRSIPTGDKTSKNEASSLDIAEPSPKKPKIEEMGPDGVDADERESEIAPDIDG